MRVVHSRWLLKTPKKTQKSHKKRKKKRSSYELAKKRTEMEVWEFGKLKFFLEKNGLQWSCGKVGKIKFVLAKNVLKWGCGEVNKTQNPVFFVFFFFSLFFVLAVCVVGERSVEATAFAQRAEGEM